MKILTAYFSHNGENYFAGKIINIEEGNTSIVAKKIAAITGSELFEIKRAAPYPIAYRDCVKEAVEELKAAARPALAENKDVAGYDAVILCYPNWCGTMPTPVFAFLERGAFAGKRIFPLCTNEGSGLGSSERDIKRLCPDAEVAAGLSVKGGNARDCDEYLIEWLEKNGLRP